MSYAIYLRKSRKDTEAEARGAGETLARHRAALMRLAKQNHYPVVKTYEEVVSGDSIAARPEMQCLLTDVGNGLYDGVLVMEIERLARGDTIDQGIVAQTFRSTATLIITPGKVYDPTNDIDETFFEFGLFMSRQEYKTIKRRLHAGILAAKQEGKFVGSWTPYGYRSYKLPNAKGFSLEPNPKEAPYLKRIFDWYVNGMELEGKMRSVGAAMIATGLNRMNVPTRHGREWMPCTIRTIIRNPVYAGKICYNRSRKPSTAQHSVCAPSEDWIVVDGLHEALVSVDTWNAAQSKMDENKAAPVPGGHPMQNPLAGLVICGKCGRKMQRRPYANRQTNLICPCSSCSNSSAPIDEIEDAIIGAIKEWVRGYMVAPTVTPDELDFAAENLARIEKDLQDCQSKREKIYDSFEAGLYTEEIFVQRIQAMETKVKKLTTDKADAARALKKKKAQLDQRMSLPAILTLLDAYYQMDVQGRNAALREILDSVTYTRERGAGCYKNRNAFSIAISPKVPKV